MTGDVDVASTAAGHLVTRVACCPQLNRGLSRTRMWLPFASRDTTSYGGQAPTRRVPMSDTQTPRFEADVVIVGGCGRVGLPLGIALASRGKTVTLYDINATAVETVNAARLPFAED